MISLISSVVIPLVVFLFILLEIDLSLEMIHQITQIGFYVITAVIAILTFCQAKKTIFSPMKKEMFIMQLELFTEFNKLFWKIHDDQSFYEEFDLKQIFLYNINIVLFKKRGFSEKNAKYETDNGLNAPLMKIIEDNPLRDILICPAYQTTFEANFYLPSAVIRKCDFVYELSNSIFVPESIQASAEKALARIGSNIKHLQNYFIENSQDILSGGNTIYQNFEADEEPTYHAYMDLVKQIRIYTKTDEVMN